MSDTAAPTSASDRILRDKWSIWEATIPQILWSALPDGGLDFINSRWTEYSGQRMEDACPNGWANTVHPDDLPNALAQWTYSLATGEPYEVLFRLQRVDGAYRWHIARATALRDADGAIAHWYGTNTDIEDQKRNEQALIRNEKLAAAGRLSASIAHEINNPLEAVTNLLYLANEAAQSPELQEPVRTEIAEYLALAQQELVRVSEIVTHTLRFHRQTTQATECIFSELMESVLTLFDGRLRHAQIEVRRDYRDAVPMLCWNGEIRQVFANLVSNALDAMRTEGGTLQMRAVNAMGLDGMKGIRTTIADTGNGMTAETARRIFEPFFTTKQDVGTGLGLWLCKGIIEKHSAALRFRSSQQERMHGTVFSIFWPQPDIQAS